MICRVGKRSALPAGGHCRGRGELRGRAGRASQIKQIDCDYNDRGGRGRNRRGEDSGCADCTDIPSPREWRAGEKTVR